MFGLVAGRAVERHGTGGGASGASGGCGADAGPNSAATPGVSPLIFNKIRISFT